MKNAPEPIAFSVSGALTVSIYLLSANAYASILTVLSRMVRVLFCLACG